MNQEGKKQTKQNWTRRLQKSEEKTGYLDDETDMYMNSAGYERTNTRRHTPTGKQSEQATDGGTNRQKHRYTIKHARQHMDAPTPKRAKEPANTCKHTSGHTTDEPTRPGTADADDEHAERGKPTDRGVGEQVCEGVHRRLGGQSRKGWGRQGDKQRRGKATDRHQIAFLRLQAAKVGLSARELFQASVRDHPQRMINGRQPTMRCHAARLR